VLADQYVTLVGSENRTAKTDCLNDSSIILYTFAFKLSSNPFPRAAFHPGNALTFSGDKCRLGRDKARFFSFVSLEQPRDNQYLMRSYIDAVSHAMSFSVGLRF